MSKNFVPHCRLEEESENLLKGSDTLESCIYIRCLADTFLKMFRSRNDHCKSTTGRNKDVSIPLVRDRDMEEASALKVMQTLSYSKTR